MPRPVHFEIPAENPQRAINFYTRVFGWTFKKWDPQDVSAHLTNFKGLR